MYICGQQQYHPDLISLRRVCAHSALVDILAPPRRTKDDK